MYNRWYDKYPNLKSLMLLLETVDEHGIELIAQDFLQVILEKYGDRFDSVIQEIKENSPPQYKRWYDNNYTLHTCIELLKILDDNEKEELVNSFVMSLMSFITNVDNQ